MTHSWLSSLLVSCSKYLLPVPSCKWIIYPYPSDGRFSHMRCFGQSMWEVTHASFKQSLGELLQSSLSENWYPPHRGCFFSRGPEQRCKEQSYRQPIMETWYKWKISLLHCCDLEPFVTTALPKRTDTNTLQAAFLTLFPITLLYLFHLNSCQTGWLAFPHSQITPILCSHLLSPAYQPTSQNLTSIFKVHLKCHFLCKAFPHPLMGLLSTLYNGNYYNLFIFGGLFFWYFSNHVPSKHHKFLKDYLIHNVFNEALQIVGIHTSICLIKLALSTKELLFSIFTMFLKADFMKHLTYSLSKQN